MQYKLEDKVFKEQSFDVEKFLVAGILNYPKLYEELDSLIITSADFNSRIHQDIWVYFGEVLKKNGSVDYKILGLKMMELKLSYGMDLTPLDYLEALSLIKIEENSVRHYAAKLKTLSLRKSFVETHMDIVNDMLDFRKDLSFEEIVNLVDKKANAQTNLFDQHLNEPIDVYGTLREYVESRGNSAQEYGIVCPYPILRAKFGDFYPGDLYIFASRMKSGKSTLIMNLLDHCCCRNISQDVRGLFLDTELTTEEFQARAMSILTGINENYIRKGTWRKNADYVERVRNAWPQIELFFNRIHHIKVGDKSIEEVGSIMRRWYKKNIKEGQHGLIIYDYIKIVSDLASDRYNRMKGYEIAGFKTNYVKELSKELQCPIISSVQTNRGNASKKLDKREDDATVISLSDQIGQFCSNLYLFNALVPEEFQNLQVNYGLDCTHRLVPIVTRRQGDDAPGFNNLVKVEDADGGVTYKENEIFYNFNNFRVDEVTDLASLVGARRDYKLESGEKDGEMLDD